MRFNKFDAAMTVPSAPAETSMYAWRRQQQLSNTAWQHWKQAREDLSVTNTKTLTDDDYYINFDGEQK